jgi:hypothetical protein
MFLLRELVARIVVLRPLSANAARIFVPALFGESFLFGFKGSRVKQNRRHRFCVVQRSAANHLFESGQ